MLSRNINAGLIYMSKALSNVFSVRLTFMLTTSISVPPCEYAVFDVLFSLQKQNLYYYTMNRYCFLNMIRNVYSTFINNNDEQAYYQRNLFVPDLESAMYCFQLQMNVHFLRQIIS